MRKNKWRESNRDTLIKKLQMPASLTSYQFQLESDYQGRKKQFLVKL